MTNKPVAKLIGEDSNIFNLAGIASRVLKRVGMRAEAVELRERVFKAESYDDALQIIMDYVEIE